ncbi:hypothetical protein L7F22_066815 [Adiantum nelumboides]|nr:hypothetical protein [Adiantum nelumboides]
MVVVPFIIKRGHSSTKFDLILLVLIFGSTIKESAPELAGTSHGVALFALEESTSLHLKFLPARSSIRRPMDRVELGAVMFEPNVFGMKGPRKITAIIPAFDSDDRPYVFDPQFQGSTSILHRYRSGYDHEKMVVMKSKLPEWNKELRSYCLNFHGRATHTSVKNFQLVTEFDNEHILLQLGKVGKNNFTLDYCHPLSALQAFSIAISALDRKFA